MVLIVIKVPLLLKMTVSSCFLPDSDILNLFYAKPLLISFIDYRSLLSISFIDFLSQHRFFSKVFNNNNIGIKTA